VPIELDPFGLERLLRERLGFEEECRIGGEMYFSGNADIFEQTKAEPITNGDNGRRSGIQSITHGTASVLRRQRSGADGIEHNGKTQFLGNREVTEVAFRASIVKQTPTAEDERIQLRDFRGHLLSRQRARGDYTLDPMPSACVLGVVGEHGDVGRHCRAELA